MPFVPTQATVGQQTSPSARTCQKSATMLLPVVDEHKSHVARQNVCQGNTDSPTQACRCLQCMQSAHCRCCCSRSMLQGKARGRTVRIGCPRVRETGAHIPNTAGVERPTCNTPSVQILSSCCTIERNEPKLQNAAHAGSCCGCLLLLLLQSL
jgi:hypothetical protein